MSRRRYKVGLHPHYDKAFDHLKGYSPLLSRGEIDTNSVPGLKAEIEQQTGKVARAETKIQEADERFENMQAVAKREGRAVPETMPPELVEVRLLAEAKFDICREELDILKKLLAAQETKEKQVKSEDILPFGPDGAGKLRDGILAEIDGQMVSFDKEKDCLVIDCESSPYNRLPVYLYYAMVRTWKKERAEARSHAAMMSQDLTLPKSERELWFEKTRRRPVPPSQWPARPPEV